MINPLLFWYEFQDTYNDDIQYELIPEESIIFIAETKQLITRGIAFGGGGEVINNLTTQDPDKALSAQMGYELNQRLTPLEANVQDNELVTSAALNDLNSRLKILYI